MAKHVILSPSLVEEYANMRGESDNAPGTFQQLCLALRGHTWKLVSLYFQVKALKSDLEVGCTTLC